MKDSFYQLLRDSVLVQATVTLMLIGTILYMYVVQEPVPDDLMSITMLVVGFWFGSKSQAGIDRVVSNYVTKR